MLTEELLIFKHSSYSGFCFLSSSSTSSKSYTVLVIHLNMGREYFSELDMKLLSFLFFQYFQSTSAFANCTLNGTNCEQFVALWWGTLLSWTVRELQEPDPQLVWIHEYMNSVEVNTLPFRLPADVPFHSLRVMCVIPLT